MRNVTTPPPATLNRRARFARLAGLPGVQALPQGLALLGGDALAALLSWGAVDVLMRWVNNPPLARTYVLVWIGIWLLLRAYQGLYPGYGRSPQTELRLHTIGTLEAGIAQFAVTFASHDFDKSRLGYGLLWLLILFLALPVRYALRALLIRLRVFGRGVSVIGAGKTGALTVKYLQEHPAYGLRPVAVYDDNLSLVGRDLHGVPIVGTIAQAGREPRSAHAIVSIPGARADVQSRIVNAMYAAYPITWATPDFFGVPNQALVPHNMGSHATLELRNNLRSPRARFIKRTLDVLAGTLILLLVSPVFLLIALAIKGDSPGPAVYRARRLGRGGAVFPCLKFRTMHRDADEKLALLLEQHPELRAEYAATHKLKEDPRVTRVGAFLRKTSLDELPQLLNVLSGEMSLVGPRPIVQAEIEKYGRVYDVYTQVRPGLTGFWQVNGRSDTSYDERVGMDNFYITNWTPWLDLVILVQTVRVVLLGKGAY